MIQATTILTRPAEEPAETSELVYSDDGQALTLDQRGSLAVSLGYHPNGQLTSVNAAGASYVIVPDTLGRPTQVTQTGAEGAGTYGFTYDGPVPVTESVTVPGYTATLTRNVSHSTGRLDSFVVSDDGTSTTLSQGLAPSAPFDGSTPFFTASALREGDTSPDLRLIGAPSVTPSDTSVHEIFRADVINEFGTASFRTQHGLNAWGETRRLLSGVPATSGAGVADVWFQDEVCARDVHGRITRRIEVYRDGVGLASLRYIYSYDAAGRLSGAVARRHSGAITCETTTGGTAVPGNFLTSYDDAGNRTFAGGDYNADDQLLRTGTGSGARDYRYDAVGRLNRRRQPSSGSLATVRYRWTGTHRLRQTEVGVTTRSYQHDLLGRVVAIRGGASTGDPDQFFVYRDGLEPVAWTRGGVHQYYVYGTQPHVPDLIYEDNDDDPYIDVTYRVITDERGSVRMVVRVDGGPLEVVQRIEYDAWGVPTFAVGDSTVQPFGFAGAIYLSHAGLWHMGAREYDPSVGRWISKDPIRFAGGTGLYLYCENDPVNCIDRGGNIPLLIATALIGAVGGAVFTATQSYVQNCGRIDVSDVVIGAGVGALVGLVGPLVGLLAGAEAFGGALALGGSVSWTGTGAGAWAAGWESAPWGG
jgi:RHS repeat-associated protein